jgi:xanthine dehydrogenase molybdopterin-binding subunit B
MSSASFRNAESRRRRYTTADLEIAANRPGVAEDLELKERRVRVKGDPEKGMSIKEAIREGLRSRPVMGRGYYMPNLDFQTGWVTGKLTGQRTGAYTFGAVTAEVEVDPETGTVRVLKAVGAQDVGFALNPMAVEGQNEGSLSLGQGQALYEKIWIKNMLNQLPRLSAPYPQHAVMETVSSKSTGTCFWRKERKTEYRDCPCNLNAITIYGVRIRELPAPPERIPRIRKKSRKDG